MKQSGTLIQLGLLFLLVLPVWANDDHEDGDNQCKPPITQPVTPKNGRDGKPGKDGQSIQGPVGAPGKNAELPKDTTKFVVGAELRAYDSRYLQIKPFVDVIAYGGYEGSNDIVAGIRFQFKITKSYEEKRLDALEKRERTLEDAYNVLQMEK